MKMVNNCRFVAAGQNALIAHEKHQTEFITFQLCIWANVGTTNWHRINLNEATTLRELKLLIIIIIINISSINCLSN